MAIHAALETRDREHASREPGQRDFDAWHRGCRAGLLIEERGRQDMTRATFLSSVTTMMMTAVIGMPMGHAQPAGSYQQSCEGSMVRGSTLISSCKDRRGIFH